MDHYFTYRTGSIDDLQQLKKVAYAAYSQYQTILTPENWEKLHNGLNDEVRLVELINKSTVFVCETEQKIVGAAYLIPKGNPTAVFKMTGVIFAC